MKFKLYNKVSDYKEITYRRREKPFEKENNMILLIQNEYKIYKYM